MTNGLRAYFIKAVDADESQLTSTTLPSFGVTWLTPRLGKFRAKHPRIARESPSNRICRNTHTT
ncbi:MAG: hypothetical protein ABIN56_09475 [Dokdonella sp.]